MLKDPRALSAADLSLEPCPGNPCYLLGTLLICGTFFHVEALSITELDDGDYGVPPSGFTSADSDNDALLEHWLSLDGNELPQLTTLDDRPGSWLLLIIPHAR